MTRHSDAKEKEDTLEFVKIYSTPVQNAKKTLANKVAIEPLLAKVTSTELRSALASLRDYGELNFWDFGVRATTQISADDSVKIICLDTCYSGRIVRKIDDSTGELGDLLGWGRLFNAPWQHPCALVISSSSKIGEHEIKAIVNGSRQTAPHFYTLAVPTRKPEALIEGNIVELALTTHERNPAARKACLAHYGPQCQVCGFDFGKVYGQLGQDFIHVHHLAALSQVREAHVVDPIRDLIPVCPNCHAMLHIIQGPPLSIAALQEIIKANLEKPPIITAQAGNQ
jgi:hypothetical protein